MTTYPRGNWPFPTDIRFGVGRVAELPDACRSVGMSRPLLVTDERLATLAVVREVLAANERAGLPTTVFAGVRSNPVGQNILDGAAVLRRGGHDGVIVMGGGSALDAGKAIALMKTQTRPLWDFVWGKPVPTDVDEAGIPPIIAVPTTAGTGSEVEAGGVITDERTRSKEIIVHPRIKPAIVIGDPALTVGLPPALTAATGMDALSHCLEAYCVPDYDPMADGMALEGMRLIAEWLPVAHADGTNLKARSHMLAAATIGAAAFRKGLGAMHALSHLIGAMYDTHHGLTNAVVMPYVLRFNQAAIDEKLTRLARWLGLPKASFDGVMEWVLSLRKQIGIPHTLAELKVQSSQLDRFSEMAAVDPCAGGNPVKAGVPEMKRMYQAALSGSV